MCERRVLALERLGHPVAPAVGFLGAAVNPGPGPRVVKHSLSLGPLYLPPLLVGLTALAIAGLVAASRLRWAPATGAAFAAVLMVGAATLGSAAISYRLTHPGAIIGFAEDTLQLAGEVIALVAGLGATVQAYRVPPRPGHPGVPDGRRSGMVPAPVPAAAAADECL